MVTANTSVPGLSWQDRLSTLVDLLVAQGSIERPEVEAAFRAVPRHLFLPSHALEAVYADDSISTKLEGGQVVSSSSRPSLMARMLEQLAPRPGQRVLEIGTGTGYNAALLAHLVGPEGWVTSVEIDQDLADSARANLERAGVRNVTVLCRDGGEGCPEGAPYDRVLLTVGSWDVSPAWSEQLAGDGRLVLPLSLAGPQTSIAFERDGAGFRSTSLIECGFVRLRGSFAGSELRLPLSWSPPTFVGFDEPREVDPGRLFAQLGGEAEVERLGVALSYRELWGGLLFWLALDDPDFFGMSAQGPQSQEGLVPYLLGRSGHFCDTCGSFGGDGFVLLSRGGDVRPPAEPPPEAEPFDLFVHRFGDGVSARDRLRAAILAWDQSGRPGLERLVVRLWPRGQAVELERGEVARDRRWHQLLSSWRAA
jgi:protein-L-isoaspartate(D-aspartate) O-methyltransferase